MAWRFSGNERAVAALQRALAAAAPAHAYLFAGPERVGKATLALRLAQALNCAGEDPPCDSCEPCRRVGAGIHADVRVVGVEAAEEGPQHKAISIGQVREVERAVALAPFEGRTRVVIIDPADAMTTEAQNALLKTLEEPPARVVFVLVSAHEEALLPTIRSRCRRLELRLLPVAEIEKGLRSAPGGGAGPEQARLLARLARGRIGWALEMANDPARLEQRRQALESARAPVAMSVSQRLETAERLAGDFRRDRESLLALLAEWEGWWRDVLLVQSSAGDGVSNLDMLGELREEAGRCSRSQVAAFVRALGQARRQLQANVQPRLALEVLLLEAPGVPVNVGLP